MTTNTELHRAIIEADAAGMSTEALVEHCQRQVPGCTPPQIAAALRAVAAEQLREAEQLETFARCRRAGIRRVVRGGGDAA
jgi:hypothetical protein